MEKQYQHFLSKFLLRNFSEDTLHVCKFENNKWEHCKIDETGGEDCFYGPFDCTLEVFFSYLEKIAA